MIHWITNSRHDSSWSLKESQITPDPGGILVVFVAYLKPSMLGARYHIPPWAASVVTTMHQAQAQAQDYSDFLAYLPISPVFSAPSLFLVWSFPTVAAVLSHIPASLALCWSLTISLPFFELNFPFLCRRWRHAPEAFHHSSQAQTSDFHCQPCQTRYWWPFCSWMPSSWLRGGFC